MDVNESVHKSVGGGVRRRDAHRKMNFTFITEQHNNLIEFLNIHIDVRSFRYGYRTSFSCPLIEHTFVSYTCDFSGAAETLPLSQSARG